MTFWQYPITLTIPDTNGLIVISGICQWLHFLKESHQGISDLAFLRWCFVGYLNACFTWMLLDHLMLIVEASLGRKI